MAKIKFANMNVNGLLSGHRIEEVFDYMETFKIDAACIQETKLKPKIKDDELIRPGFDLFRKDRKRKEGGGVAVLVRSFFKPVLLKMPDNPILELIAVKIQTATHEANWSPQDNEQQG